MKTKILVALGVAGVAMSGCATNPNNIAAQSVSPLQYEQYNCNQIGAETERVNRRAGELHGRLEKTANNDTAQMVVGAVLFWPALFFLEGGDGPEAAEYARIKGEKDALERVAVLKECGTVASKPPVEQEAMQPVAGQQTTQPVEQKAANPEQQPSASVISEAAQR